MRVTPFLKKLTVVSVLGTGLSVWAAACGGHTVTPSTSASAPAAPKESESGVASLVPKAFLPHPAFAATGSSGDVSIADIAERVAPSVVNVSSSRTVKNVHERMPFFDDPFFRQFFGPGLGPGGPQEERRQEHGLGSGVIVSEGVVVTNNHVVDGADEIKVITADKREFPAKVVGTDKKSDVAVLRISGDVSSLKPLEMGDSSRLRLGDIVLAIGNPFGVGQTITMGIVSAKGRANVGIAAYEDFIQTDAAINPGNSGGALVDMEGRLVGINTAILSRSGGNMGIGFAIPSNMVQPIMKSLLETGKVVRGWLGVGIQDIDQKLASAMNLSSVKGILVSEAIAGGPGEKAGLKSGDVVLKLNGEPMDSTGRFRNAIAAAGAGATVKLEIQREGKTLTVDAKLGELPDKEPGGQGKGDASPAGSLDGLSIESLDAANRRKFDVPASVKSGVVVTDIDQGSPAAESGLRPGDVVVEVNRVPVTDIDQFKKAYTKVKDRTLLRVLRDGRMLFVAVSR
ncbi:MAG TPA: Do family serine endopeptidase [Polyangiaceae bacterium]|nr:Do family serine endopeptidase [Polyangiaceae bacterium]